MDWLSKLVEVDHQFFLFLNGFHNDFWDTVMFFVTRKETWLPFFAVLLCYIIKNYKNKTVIILLFLALAILAGDQISVLIKESVQRLRPVHDPVIRDLVHNYYRKGGLYGFLSSHATNAFALLTFSAYLFRNRYYTYTLLLWALLFSYSRIYLGVHYPFDILGGMVLGYFVGNIFYRVLMFVENLFFITRQPTIASTTLSKQNAATIFLVFIVTFAVVLISSRNLYAFNIL